MLKAQSYRLHVGEALHGENISSLWRREKAAKWSPDSGYRPITKLAILTVGVVGSWYLVVQLWSAIV